MSDEVENTAEVMKSPETRVEVSADLLNEAVTQLRKLTELRQREAERQERAIAQMQKAIKRQGLLSRYVILTCTLAVLIGIGLAYLISENSRKADVAAESLLIVDDRLADAAKVITRETKRQASGLDDVRTEVVATRENQVKLSSAISEELQASRDVQSTVIQKVEEQLTAVREERDQIRGEVRTVLEEKTREITTKEMALASEREAIVEATKKSKEEQKALILQTIERLTAMSASLTPEEQETETPTETEVEQAVEAAEAVAAEIESETAEEPAAEEPAVE